ncbi:FAD-binding oxidoreductase [Mesorhizobium sp. IMUNJ 23232]|uniref:FAD-binding oxidoreductase n=1 Tax=Mesorhizobium sp. IMUNJ 23232 TaxID=3376064 RepID=UPI0037A72DF1
MSNLTASLTDLLGPSGWLTGPDVEPYRRDWLDRYGVDPVGVARPGDTVEVAAVVRLCRDAGIALVPQGGKTGLCAASIATDTKSIILSLQRMSGIGKVDAASSSIEVGAGVILQRLNEAVEPAGFIFPMHLGAEGSAQIGGLIGTNAGGSHASRYGMMQDLVLGLEVVTADGDTWNGLRAVQKDNAGYQLRKLFCGSEGTLGIVTRAVLRLYPAPKQRSTALLALPDLRSAVAFGALLRGEAAEFTSGIEFLSDVGLEMALRHIPKLSFPLDTRAAAYVLVELTSSSARVPLDDILSSALEDGMELGLVLDGTIAMSDAQRSHFWQLREEQPEGQRIEGLQLKHDISVPAGSIAMFVEEGGAICEQILPGVRINPFGHLADGNIHFNLSPPIGRSDFAGKAEELGNELAALAARMGGSFAAEHGLGRSKIGLADRIRSPIDRDLMRRIKAAFDPAGLMNPGVLVTAGQ